MFMDAVAKARQFTFPAIQSRQTASGECSSSVAALVVINDEGWFLTAAHVFDGWSKLLADREHTIAHLGAVDKIQASTELDRKAKKQQFRALGELDLKNATKHCSSWWAQDGLSVKEAYALGPVDLAVGRLDPWDPSWVAQYPEIKNPNLNFELGRSLCKLGYPYPQMKTSYDAARDAFEIVGVPPPFFPIEGILTGIEEIVMMDAQGAVLPPHPYPLRYLHTSSPGLRGQSGGPIFDANGAIWAIQSATISYPLNLEGANQPPKIREHFEHQFLNVGRGTHAISIVGLLDEKGIKFKKSEH